MTITPIKNSYYCHRCLTPSENQLIKFLKQPSKPLRPNFPRLYSKIVHSKIVHANTPHLSTRLLSLESANRKPIGERCSSIWKKIQKNLTQFLTTTLPPRYGHQLNFCESLGNAALYLFASSVGTFSIKDKNLISRISAIALIIISLPLTILGTIIKAVGTAWPHKNVLATDAIIKETAPLKLRQCYDLAEAMKKVFMENNLTRTKNGEIQPAFVMVSGTALGAIRHGGIIPWDDDCDFAILKPDVARFLELRDALLREGIQIRDMQYDSTFKLRFTNEKLQEKYGTVSDAEIGENDLFIFDKMSDGCYTYASPLSRSRWPTEYFTPEDMERGFEMKPFGPPEKGLSLPLLKRPDDYLARYYGDNWRDFGIETHGHLSFNYRCGSIQIPFFKLGAHYFKIEKWKGIPAAWA